MPRPRSLPQEYHKLALSVGHVNRSCFKIKEKSYCQWKCWSFQLKEREDKQKYLTSFPCFQMLNHKLFAIFPETCRILNLVMDEKLYSLISSSVFVLPQVCDQTTPLQIVDPSWCLRSSTTLTSSSGSPILSGLSTARWVLALPECLTLCNVTWNKS